MMSKLWDEAVDELKKQKEEYLEEEQQQEEQKVIDAAKLVVKAVLAKGRFVRVTTFLNANRLEIDEEKYENSGCDFTLLQKLLKEASFNPVPLESLDGDCQEVSRMNVFIK